MQAKAWNSTTLDHTPSADVAAGDVVVVEDLVCVARDAITADTLGSLETEGIFKVVKASEALSQGVKIYWDEDGDPVGGTAGTGAATATSADNKLMGYAAAAAATAGTTVLVKLER